MKFHPLNTLTGRQIVSTWLYAAAETFGRLGNAARKAPKPVKKVPSWYEKVEN